MIFRIPTRSNKFNKKSWRKKQQDFRWKFRNEEEETAQNCCVYLLMHCICWHSPNVILLLALRSAATIISNSESSERTSASFCSVHSKFLPLSIFLHLLKDLRNCFSFFFFPFFAVHWVLRLLALFIITFFVFYFDIFIITCAWIAIKLEGSARWMRNARKELLFFVLLCSSFVLSMNQTIFHYNAFVPLVFLWESPPLVCCWCRCLFVQIVCFEFYLEKKLC